MARHGQTLYEKFIDWWREEQEQPPECRIFNPLKLRLGSIGLSIDVPDLYDKAILMVTEIHAYDRMIDGVRHPFTDYRLQEDGTNVLLRVIPIEGAAPYAHEHCNMAVLFPDLTIPYGDPLHDALMGEVGKDALTVNTGDESVDYTRIGYVLAPHTATVTILDTNGNFGKEAVQYWDYFRNTEFYEEFYFVEMNTDTGIIQTHRGRRVSEREVRLPADLIEDL